MLSLHRRVRVCPAAVTRMLNRYVPAVADAVVMVNLASRGVVPDNLSKFQVSEEGRFTTWIEALLGTLESTCIVNIALSPRCTVAVSGVALADTVIC